MQTATNTNMCCWIDGRQLFAIIAGKPVRHFVDQDADEIVGLYFVNSTEYAICYKKGGDTMYATLKVRVGVIDAMQIRNITQDNLKEVLTEMREVSEENKRQ